MFAWGDNDHGQQGNSTTTVNRKPALVQGLEGYKISKVACGSSHSIAWCTTDMSTPTTHDPVLFSTSRDPLGAGLIGISIIHNYDIIARNVVMLLVFQYSMAFPHLGNSPHLVVGT